MSDQMSDQGIYLFCACSTVPFLLGIAATLIIQRRMRLYGLPWAFLPGSGLIRGLWSKYHE